MCEHFSISAADLLKSMAADYYYPFEGTLHRFSRKDISFHNGAYLTMDENNGGSVSMDSARKSWVSLGTFTHECIVSPSACSKGFAISFKYLVRAGETGILFSSGAQNHGMR